MDLWNNSFVELTQAISIFDFVKSFFKFSFAFVRTSPSYVSSLSSIDIFKYTPNPTTGQPSTYVSNDYIHLFISRDPIPKSDLSVMLSLLKQTTFHLDMGEGTQHYLDVGFFSLFLHILLIIRESFFLISERAIRIRFVFSTEHLRLISHDKCRR